MPPIASAPIYERLWKLSEQAPVYARNGKRVGSPGSSTDPGAGGQSSPDQTVSDGLTERRIVDALHLDVLGERDNGTIVVLFASHESRRKTVEIREPDRLSYAKLLQVAGPPVREMVDESGGEESHSRFSMSQVRNAICYLAGERRISDQTLSSVGCWQPVDEAGDDVPGVVAVGAGESAVWDEEKLERIVKPRAGGRLLHLSSSEPWYHFRQLAANLERCTPEWAKNTAEEAIALFGRWRWRHHSHSPTVVTGLVLASWVQTLWAWRPQIAITGASKTGKSTLFEALGGLFDGLALRSSDSTAAGIRQALQTSAKVVLCDEFENSRYRDDILKMLRNASRGDESLRGTTGSQKGLRFVLRHIVWVAAIEVGLKRAPDRNRFICLELIHPKPEDRGKLTTPPAAELHDLGQRLLAVAVRNITPAKALALRLKAHKVEGIDSRVIESYAVPAAILAISCGWSESEADGLLKEMLMTSPPEDQNASDEEDLLEAIVRASVRIDREIKTVAELINDGGLDATQSLERHGLCLAYSRTGPRATEYEPDTLFMDHKDIGTKLLKGTSWEGQNLGTILQRVAGAVLERRRVAGRRTYGVSLPMDFLRREVLGTNEDESHLF